jgi:protein SCO1/2
VLFFGGRSEDFILMQGKPPLCYALHMKERRRDRKGSVRTAGPSAGYGLRRKLFLPAVLLALLIGAVGVRWVMTSRLHDVIGGPYALKDGYGHSVSQADFYGRYTLIYFGYTHCADVCPLTLGTISSALAKLGEEGRKITPIFITIDPERDTADVMRTYVAHFSPRIIGLTGTAAELRPVMKAFRITVQHHTDDGMKHAIDHNSILYLMDDHNHLLKMISSDSSADQMAHDIEMALEKSGKTTRQ